MNIHQIEKLKDYTAYVREKKEEAEKLFRDLLIGVTNFFRDPAAFDTLKNHLTGLLLPEIKTRNFRAWVVGCATGEEAYSLAIILSEALEELGKALKVEIYATDLDPEGIEKARTGKFPRNIEADVSEERLRRFFIDKEDYYQVRQQIREMVIFAEQNVTSDPPFSNMHLISCRNLLMYLKPQAQKHVLGQFIYSLQPHGVLFLGSSESITSFSKSFELVDKKYRIFMLKNGISRKVEYMGNEFPDYGGKRYAERTDKKIQFKQAAERFLLDACCPASVLVNRNGDILYYHGRTGKYLEPRQGPPSHNILEMARKGLAFNLSTALSSAAAKDEIQSRHGVRVQTNDHETLVDVYIRPAGLNECDQDCFMISFVDVPDQK